MILNMDVMWCKFELNINTATNWCRISLGTPGEMLYVANVLYGLRENSLI